MVETAVYLDDILKILGWTLSKYKRHRKRLHAAGAIFYDKEGAPPQLRVKAFPSKLQRYLHLYSKKNYFGN